MSLLTKTRYVNTQPSEDIISIHTTSDVQNIGYPRASSLYSSCMRKHVIGTLYKLKDKRVVGFNRNLTFDIGSSIHSLFQNDPKYFGDSRRGLWECLSCGKVKPFGKPPMMCNHCKSTSLIYQELSVLMHEPLCVTGHPDMFIEPEDSHGSIRVVELKTINGEKFLTLQAPLIEHVWQIQTYMWACNKLSFDLSVRIDSNYGYIIYISKKETRDTLPVKVFVMQKDERVLEEIKSKLRIYKESMATKKLPPCDDACLSSSFTSWKSRSCPALKLCKGLTS